MRHYFVYDTKQEQATLEDIFSHESYYVDSALLPDEVLDGMPLIFHIKENEDDNPFQRYYRPILLPYEEGPNRYAAFACNKIASIDARALPKLKKLPCILLIAINVKGWKGLIELYKYLTKTDKE